MPPHLGDARASTLLAGAGINPDAQAGPISALSGGHKARLARPVLRLTQPDFYIMDEPTNHVDIEGQKALEAEVPPPDASGLIVSHDRRFIRAAGTRFWPIGPRRLEAVDSPEDWFARTLALAG